MMGKTQYLCCRNRFYMDTPFSFLFPHGGPYVMNIITTTLVPQVFKITFGNYTGPRVFLWFGIDYIHPLGSRISDEISLIDRIGHLMYLQTEIIHTRLGLQHSLKNSSSFNRCLGQSGGSILRS